MSETAARNEEIARRVEAGGETYRQLGEEFGLSVERVGQIARLARTRREAGWVPPQFAAPWSDEDRAYCAAAWAGGETQKSLAQTYHTGSWKICEEIKRFLIRYNRVYMDQRWLDPSERKPGVPVALQEFLTARGGAIYDVP